MAQLRHEKIVISTGRRSGLPVIVAVHSTALGQAVGGCRLWRYDDWRAGLEDALRLSNAMTLKCALAGVPWGGGKSVLPVPPRVELTPSLRRDLLHDLGDVVESLGGTYGVAEDVGTTAQDMATIAERTEFAYGLPQAAGGVGEPSAPTAAGVFDAILVTAEQVWGTRDLAGRQVGVVGLGQVGSRLATSLGAAGAKLVVTDVDRGKRELAEALGATWVEPEQALAIEADVLVPAALGGSLTPSTVGDLRCRAVVGPANNQLSDDGVAALLAQRGILWAPDFLVNAGGVLYGHEMEVGSRNHDTAMAAVTGIADTLRDVFARATHEGITPLAAANALAEDRIAAASAR
ncbi:Glu/Leu/Phe/Val dehydrogenase dimerization domain-containing protein [Actinoplanes sp. NPDC049265]|uniref:Glu/Leu/Phe/Val dehydrogenase family protein n=1 Tax=Actinoplanes sp. NPDC049265 TaxID=3363902 RepID=UPI0037193A75